VILDAAVAGNNVAGHLGASQRRAVVSSARRSLDRLKAAAHHLNRADRRAAGVAFRAAFSRTGSPSRRVSAPSAKAVTLSSPVPQKRGLLAWATQLLESS
jgi:hypothetical protein